MFAFRKSIISQTRVSMSRRSIHVTCATSTPHSTDSYNKGVDDTPPPDSQIHRVDPDSGNVQKPHEKPSNKFSQVGAKSAMDTAYSTVSKDEPYKAPGPTERYGGVEDLKSRDGEPGEGPEGKDSHGRK